MLIVSNVNVIFGNGAVRLRRWCTLRAVVSLSIAAAPVALLVQAAARTISSLWTGSRQARSGCVLCRNVWAQAQASR